MGAGRKREERRRSACACCAASLVHLQGHEPPTSPNPTAAHLLLQLRLTLGAQLGHLGSTPLLLRHAVLHRSRQAGAGQGGQTHSS